ncbi:terminase large subunit [Aureimonas leprariae]|uniref:Terminase large subunit n=1 Tax=Plantimonas leprariae TaxID=2615207 RepID=A0A7V7PSC0_9HYPH|nr:terminase TerL endonuclease subunit [Aureimonas leprariae]KAB0682019.1 terminase large subunit [Aureimonas leprariae]
MLADTSTAWSTACQDWPARLLAGRTLVPDLPLFEEEAARALRVFNRLRMPDVIGKPTMLDAGTNWLHPIVAALFGAYDAATNRRMLREVFLLVPKKNSKSSGAAAIMVTVMILNRRPEAEALLIAPTKKIADIAFKQAWGIIQADPELAKLFHPQKHIRTITHRRTGATLEIKAADTDVITGGKATYTFIDETHVFAKKSNAADIFVEIRGALAARPDGFLMQATTQSKEPPAGVFKAELATARKVRDGELNRPLLPVLYELPDALAENDGWKDRANWGLVNPNLGRSVDPEYLADELQKAEEEGAEALALLASQHFNVEIGLRYRTDGWIGGKYWEGAADTSITLAAVIQRCDVAVVGVDGGGLDDLLGLGVIGRCRTTKDWLAWHHAWAHDDVFERRKDIIVNLRDFEQEGTLTVAKSPTQDIDDVCEIIAQLDAAGILAEKWAVGLDQVGIPTMVDALSGIGVAGERVAAVPQGFRLNGAILGAERKLKDGTLWHEGSRMMAWVVGNAKVEQRGSAILITKQAAGRAKIDPLIGLFNAVQLMSRNPEAKRRSPYETRGVRVVG